MKVMYVAASPSNAEELQIDIEVTELQSQLLSASGEPVSLIAFPQVHIEELALKLSRHRPDVLHISAHGGSQFLEFANASKNMVKLTGTALRSFLDPESPPRLVYINACDSVSIARELIHPQSPTRSGPSIAMAIGTTAPISNRASRAGALVFYDRLLKGCSVETAFHGCRAVIETIQDAAASAELLHAIGVVPATEYLYSEPRIVAQFANGNSTNDKRGEYTLEFGVVGCPSNTVQIVFFTDDDTFLGDGYDGEEEEYGEEIALAGYLCRVVRATPVRGIMWSESLRSVYGDFRIVIAGVTTSGDSFTVSSTACAALRRYYTSGNRVTASGDISPAIAMAIDSLKKLDGTEPPTDRSLVDERKRTKRKRPTGGVHLRTTGKARE